MTGWTHALATVFTSPRQARAVSLRLSSRPSDRPLTLSGGVRAGLPTSLQVVFCGECPPRLLCGGGFGMAVRVVERLGPEHGAEHGEQAVGDGAQGTGMAMAALAQAAVFGAASGIALQGGQSPMIGDILEAAAGGQATHAALAFTGLSGDRGDATQASQARVISPSPGIPSLCAPRRPGHPAGPRCGP